MVSSLQSGTCPAGHEEGGGGESAPQRRRPPRDLEELTQEWPEIVESVRYATHGSSAVLALLKDATPGDVLSDGTVVVRAASQFAQWQLEVLRKEGCFPEYVGDVKIVAPS